MDINNQVDTIRYWKTKKHLPVTPRYDLSYDAILPVVIAVCDTQNLQTRYGYILYDILKQRQFPTEEFSYTWVVILKAEPIDHCKALISLDLELTK